MNRADIIQKSSRHAAATGRQVVMALLGLMLWMGGVGSVAAQSFPATTCAPGTSTAPPGWTIVSLTPDCNSTTTRYLGEPATWTSVGLPNIPPTPWGDTTFVYLGTASSSGTEALATTITGLQAGLVYRFSIFFYRQGPFPGAMCTQATVTVDSQAMNTSLPSDGVWTEAVFTFVAQGATAMLNVRPTGADCGIHYASRGQVQSPATDLAVIKAVSPTGAVASGSVLAYTLVATNNGPGAASNVLLRDTPSAGLDCTTPSSTATCSVGGGASCPGATVLVSSLTSGGVAIPSLPVGGQVTVTMQCTVTATGR